MTDVRKRFKRQISDATEDSLQPSDSDESSEGYGPPAALTARDTTMARASRRSAGAAANGTTSATISRSTSGSPEDRRQSIRLTVKAPPSKLREVMRVNEVDALKDVIGGGRIVDGPRRSRNAPPPRASGRRPEKPRYAEYGESDIEDDDVEEEDEDDQEEDEDELMQEAEADSNQDEEDEGQEMEDEPSSPEKSAPLPKPPKITLKQPVSTGSKVLSNPKLIVTPAKVGPVKSVEDQEMEDDEDDEEDEEGSSDLSEDEDDEEDEEDEEEEEEDDEEQEEETMQLNAGIEQGAGDELGDDEELDEDEDDLDSDDDTPGSGTATPDITKLTKRQRGRPEDSTELMALDMAPQQRKFFTDQEKAMKKDEHARKRKELTKRKIQEEKAAALNRLLKPQASKARGAAPKPETLAAAAAAAAGSPYEELEYQEKANPLYTRWISTKDGIKLGVPDEWLGKRVGRVFGAPPSNGALIQEL